jgi:hypothetical protein
LPRSVTDSESLTATPRSSINEMKFVSTLLVDFTVRHVFLRLISFSFEECLLRPTEGSKPRKTFRFSAVCSQFPNHRRQRLATASGATITINCRLRLQFRLRLSRRRFGPSIPG